MKYKIKVRTSHNGNVYEVGSIVELAEDVAANIGAENIEAYEEPAEGAEAKPAEAEAPAEAETPTPEAETPAEEGTETKTEDKPAETPAEGAEGGENQ